MAFPEVRLFLDGEKDFAWGNEFRSEALSSMEAGDRWFLRRFVRDILESYSPNASAQQPGSASSQNRCVASTYSQRPFLL